MLYFGKIEWLHKGWNHFDHPEYQLQTEDTLCHLTRSRAAAFILHLQSKLRGQAEICLIQAPFIFALIFASLLTHPCHHSAPIHPPQIYLCTGCWEEEKRQLFVFISPSVLMLQFVCCMGRGRGRSVCFAYFTFPESWAIRKRVLNIKSCVFEDLSYLKLI